MRPDVREVERAVVYRGSDVAGFIARTPSGTAFTYDRSFVERHFRTENGIALHLPFSVSEVSLSGGAVHPYFANLLPEGFRLTALRNRVKTSLDDELSLLLAAGQDPVGDICVVPEGETPWTSRASIETRHPEDADFRAAFRKSISEDELDIAEPSFAGVQEKISGAMVSFPIRARDTRREYILKLNPPGIETLVTNEHFFMRMAASCGILTARVDLVHDSHGEPGLLVERFDRVFQSDSESPTRLHVEDGCQLLNLQPAAQDARRSRQGPSVAGYRRGHRT